MVRLYLVAIEMRELTNINGKAVTTGRPSTSELHSI
jgi:hypothetical protein